MVFDDFCGTCGEVVSGIYEITNTTNGKKYIGMSRNIYSRWKSHAKAGGKCPALHSAINKYGISAFNFEVLEVCNDFDLLPALEVDYILLSNSLAPNGYNLTLGGEGVIPTDEVRKKFSDRMTALWECEDTKKLLMESLHSEEVRDRRTETLSTVRHSLHLSELLSTGNLRAMLQESGGLMLSIRPD